MTHYQNDAVTVAIVSVEAANDSAVTAGSDKQ